CGWSPRAARGAPAHRRLHRRRAGRRRRHRRDDRLARGGGQVVKHADPLGAALGVLLDRLVGEPPISPHPVALLGRALGAAERVLYRDRRAAGVAHAASGLALGAGAGTVVGATTIATYVAGAGRGRRDAAGAVA